MFRRLFGRHKKSPEPKQLLKTLRAFLLAGTWNESRRIVEEHPELLSDRVDAMIGQMLAALEESPARSLLEAHCTLLRRCREVGVGAAFAPTAEINNVNLEKASTPILGAAEAGTPKNVNRPAFTKQPAGVQSILKELAQPPQIRAMPRRVELCRQALAIVQREENPRRWAALQSELGNSLAQNPQGERAENIERALQCHQLALEVRTRTSLPEQWAATQNNLAAAYWMRIRGERADNIERAIQHYQRALEVYTRAAFPADWAMTVNNLASAYSERIRGERADNVERAIQHYQRALEVYTRTAFPSQWASAQNNLANAYSKRIRGERADNVERAIQHYQLALEVYTRTAFPVQWAGIQNNLASAYSERIRGERADNVERAIQHYQLALEVYTRAAFPAQWASAQHNLASAYGMRIRGERADNVERAIQHYQLALKVHTRAALPEQWASTQQNLAGAYGMRIRGDRADNIERALQYHQLALEVYTPTAFPEQWAKSQHNLAAAYSERIRGDRADNIERAMQHCLLALEVYTRTAFPSQWASTQRSLAAAHSNRIRGDRAENIERALQHYQLALEVHTRAAFPAQWAGAQYSLANAYSDRIRGDRTDNIERALQHYQLALEVHTRTAFPIDWARTQHSLANAYAKRLRGERAENIEQAIQHYQRALEVRTRAAFPEQWANSQNNLAVAYSNRIRGNRAENIERAIQHYQLALEVHTRTAFPEQWANAQNNLASAYAERMRGERAENIERALVHCQLALKVRTRTAFPADWARIQNNLAAAYGMRVCGDRRENIELAIQHYQLALEVFELELAPKDHGLVQQGLGQTCFAAGRWKEAWEAYEGALAATAMLYQAAATPEARQAELRQVQYIPPQLAYALARISTSAESLQRAALALETGRARWLSEALAVGVEKPPAVPGDAWQPFEAQRECVRQLEAEGRLPEGTPSKRGYLTLSKALGAARRRLSDCIEAIRAHAPDFMPEPSFDDVRAAAGDAPLVYLAVTLAGGVFFVVQTDGIEAHWLDLDGADLGTLLLQQEEDRVVGGYLPGQVADFDLEQALEELLPPLGEQVAPLAGTLRRQGAEAVTLIPGGLLGLLPLHAARYVVDGQELCLLDEFAVRYAPSARALCAAQQAAARRMGDTPHLVGVGNPTQDLSYAEAELVSVAELFPGKPHTLYGPEATREALLNLLPGATVAHLACHGRFDVDKPLDSALRLADQPLALRDLLSMEELEQLEHLQLVVLSACQTAITDFQALPDEAIGLPAGFLKAGAPTVIGTLWPVKDRSTALLMTRFYEFLLQEGRGPAEALRQAQLWLRDVTNEELAGYLESHRRIKEAAGEEGERISWALLAEERRRVRRAVDKGQGQACPYAAPYHWAAFACYGAS
ncbi:MAG: tetratricopeptide repeat protein [Chloroflexia bacterium]|nr:tetratricopeptide repeat protein [Chloroflexia bacterium]